MTENTTTETKPAAIVRTDNGPEAQLIKRQSHADYVLANGGLVYGSLEEAEADVVRAKSTTAVFSKKAKIVVNGWPVLMADPEHENAEGTKKAAAPAAPAPVTEEAPAETAKERRNRLARERRAAKKAAGN